MARVKGSENITGNIKKDVTELSQRIWGCLADATPYKRYEYYARDETIHPAFLAYWCDREVKLFIKNIKAEFGIRFEITRRDKFNDIIKKIRRLTEKEEV